MTKRIYFILAQENLFHPYYLLGMLQNLPAYEYKVIGVTVTEEIYRKGFLHYILQQYQLWGFLGFFSIAILSLVSKTLDTLNVSLGSVQSIARKYNIPYQETRNVNSKDHLATIRKLHPDIVIASTGQIFKEDILSIPSIASINRHTALLPKYGGVLPVFWAMYYDEKEFGVSIHYMTKDIDQGDILAQQIIPLEKRNSLFKNYIIGFHQSIPATLVALSHLKEKKIVASFQANPKAYFSFPDKKTLASFKKKCITFSLKDLLLYRKFF